MVNIKTMSTTQYKEGHIHHGPKEQVSASCCGINKQNLISVRAAKLWITKTWQSLDLEGATFEVIL